MTATRHSVRIGIVASLYLAGLSGCAAYEARPLSAADNAVVLEERTLEDPGLQRFVAARLAGTAASQRWDLDSLTLAALYFQPELDVARAQWDVVAAGLVTAGARPGTDVGISGGRNDTTTTPTPDLATVNANLTLETAGKRGLRKAQAEQLSEAARQNVIAVAWQIRSRLRKAYFALCAAQASEGLLQDQQRIYEAYLEVLDKQRGAGAISGFDVSRARMDAAGARLSLHDAVRRETEARAELAGVIGVPAGALDEVDFPAAALDELPPEPDLAEARRQALLNRADIQGALAEYAASESALRLEIARQYPDLSFGPSYEYDQGDNKWVLGISIALPADRNRGAIATARAQRDEAAARFTALQAGILQQVDLAVTAYRNAFKQHADAVELFAAIRKQRDVARAMFTAGALSRSDLAAVELQANTLALARLDALLQAQQTAGQVESVMQSSLDMPSLVLEEAAQVRLRQPGDAGT